MKSSKKSEMQEKMNYRNSAILEADTGRLILAAGLVVKFLQIEFDWTLHHEQVSA